MPQPYQRDGTSRLSRWLRIETPEQVEIGFEIADLGSRFQAFFLDGVLLTLSLALVGLLALWGGTALSLTPRSAGWGLALSIAILFAIGWGYFVYFEAFRGGQTPGKRWTGLRVVHEGGHPVTLRGAVIRNLMRAVDVQPALTCMVGGAVMMVHPLTQRLGDMAASTIVIRDRDAALSDDKLWDTSAPDADRPLVPEPAFRALSAFVGRRRELAPEAAARLALQLEVALREPLAGLGAGVDRPLEERLVALHAEEKERRDRAGAAVSAGSSQAAALVRTQGNRWFEYRGLVQKAQARGIDALPAPELERFAALYRLTAADLARARTYGASWPLLYSLERWVGAGHNLLYRSSGRSVGALWSWLRFGFPSLVRARAAFVLAATVLLLGPAVVSYLAVRNDPVLARDLVPGGLVARAEAATAGGPYVDVPDVFMPVMSSSIIASNIQVTFFVFAGGVLAGTATLLLLALNGVHLGSVVALYQNEGVARVLLDFVAPHGVIELTAICIAGAAGLLLGSGIIAPGRRTRRAALAERAKESVSLLAGTSLLLVLAGATEGFVSPARIPTAAKLIIATSIALAVFAYLVLAGRTASATNPAIGDPGT